MFVQTLLVLSVFAVADAKEDAIKADLQKLSGTWLVEEADFGGAKAIRAELDKVRFIIEGTKMTFRNGDMNDEGSLKIDPTQKPPTIDMFNKKMELRSLGIYELKNDKLTICFLKSDKSRPAEFAAPKDSEGVLMVLRREKK